MEGTTKRPYLSAVDIEGIVGDLLDRSGYPYLHDSSKPAAMYVVGYLAKKYGVVFDFLSRLGHSADGSQLGGLCRFRPPTILIDADHCRKGYYIFTLGHEIGHYWLHRDVEISQDDYQHQGFLDDKVDCLTGKRKLETDRDWIEWQANRFGSAIAMPASVFRRSLVEVQKEMRIDRNRGVVYTCGTSNKIDFRKIVSALSYKYRVSKTSVKIRMKELDLIVEDQDSADLHI